MACTLVSILLPKYTPSRVVCQGGFLIFSPLFSPDAEAFRQVPLNTRGFQNMSIYARRNDLSEKHTYSAIRLGQRHRIATRTPRRAIEYDQVKRPPMLVGQARGQCYWTSPASCTVGVLSLLAAARSAYNAEDCDPFAHNPGCRGTCRPKGARATWSGRACPSSSPMPHRS